ncbi:hypothetical protein MPSEU_000667100 [Mayamaea pseudoterrestris]|nr:hypothetical protein MPSEU_000667100 [Mayamaea pseudoterrestris]
MAAALSSSPSWSALFRPPNRNRRREDSDSPDSRVTPVVRRALSSSPFIDPPAWLFGRPPPVLTTPSSSAPPSPQNHPFLTVALLKLHEALPEFCKILAHNPHTQETASKASSLLDTSVATSSSPAPTSHAAAATATIAKDVKPRAAGMRSRARSQSPVRRQKSKINEASNSTINSGSLLKQQRNSKPWSSPRGDSSSRRFSVASPSSTPLLLQWFTSSATNQNVQKPVHHPSAVALEGEWDYFVAPFTLLSAAVVLQADMQHCEATASLEHALLLPALYQRIATDLLEVEATLCAPLLEMQHSLPAPLDSTRPSNTSPMRKSVTAASSLALWLQSLVNYCTLRARFADLQASLFLSSASSMNGGSTRDTVLSDASQLLILLSQSVAVHSATENVVQPLFIALAKECQVWKHSLDSCCALQSCRLYDTILSLHKWRTINYEALDPTRVSVFFQRTFRNLVALLPIYFDRILSFAGPVHGFNVRQLMHSLSSKANMANDWNGEVMEFLRRQERGGGPATAVAIVLDAVRTDNVHFERGMQFNPPAIGDEERQDVRLCWPAVYLRSNLYLGSPAVRASARSDRDSGSASNSSQSNLLPTWRKTDHHSPSMHASTARKVPVESIHSPSLMEYDGAWPRSEWEKLVTLVNSKSLATEMTANLHRLNLEAAAESNIDAPSHKTVSFQVEPEETKMARLENSMAEGAASLFDVGLNASPKSPFSRKSVDSNISPKSSAPSTFHIASLGEFVSLAVIVRAEEENRWHLRRNPLTDEEIRAFLNTMAFKLRVSEQFRSSAVPQKSYIKVRLDQYRPKHLTSDSFSDDAAEVWTDPSLEALLKVVKVEFGLRPTQEGGTILSRNSPNRKSFAFSPGRRTSAMDNRQRHQSNAVSPSALAEKSAAAFFMGSELATVIDC